MQGYIVNINRTRDEDLIVTILTEQNLETLYRFYGARHGSINIGFKIDFEIEHSVKVNIARLRDVIHIGFPWITEHHRLRIWQQFLKLFFSHLKDTQSLEPFYFNLIEKSARLWEAQNPYRVAVEAYVTLLEFEGRLHKEAICFFCEEKITDDKISLIRAYLPAHYACAHTMPLNKKALDELYCKHTSIFLDDNEIERLWYLLLEGL